MASKSTRADQVTRDRLIKLLLAHALMLSKQIDYLGGEPTVMRWPNMFAGF